MRSARSSAGPPVCGAAILPDILEPDLRVVFCGSAAGLESARRGAYYAHPGNLFWPTLFRIGLTPHRLAPEAFATLPRYGLGLTDLCKGAAGADAALPRGSDDPAALRAKIGHYRPRILAFTGKRPASVFLDRKVAYGRQETRLGGTEVFVLPSPSGLARPYWDVSWWHELADAARATV